LFRPSLGVFTGVSKAEIHIKKQIVLQRAATISLSGDVNTQIVTSDRPGKVQSRLTVAGTLDRPMDWGDVTREIDLLDILWRSGLDPKIDNKGFPRIDISKSPHGKGFDLHASITDTNGQIVATYKRTLWPPRIYPGRSGSAFSYLNMILSNNIWQLAFGRISVTDPEKEMQNFLRTAIKLPEKNDEKETPGPSRKLVQLSDSKTFIDDVTKAHYYMNNLWQSQRKQQFCQPNWAVVQLGAPGWQTRAITISNQEMTSAKSLIESFEHSYIGFICDQKNNETIIFGIEKAADSISYLRIRTYSDRGILQRNYHLKIPINWPDRGYILKPDSWQVSKDASLSFSIVQWRKEPEKYSEKVVLIAQFSSPP
jgi:hypothetical protein